MFFRKLRCSFCRRHDKDVAKLVAGARGYICDRCAHEVIRIMSAAPPDTQTTSTRAVVVEPSAEWHRTWHFATASD